MTTSKILKFDAYSKRITDDYDPGKCWFNECCGAIYFTNPKAVSDLGCTIYIGDFPEIPITKYQNKDIIQTKNGPLTIIMEYSKPVKYGEDYDEYILVHETNDSKYYDNLEAQETKE